MKRQIKISKTEPKREEVEFIEEDDPKYPRLVYKLTFNKSTGKYELITSTGDVVKSYNQTELDELSDEEYEKFLIMLKNYLCNRYYYHN